MAERVAILDPYGKFATVDASELDKVEKWGGRVLTKQENEARQVEEEYAQKPLAEKVVSLASLAGPVPYVARAAYKAATGQNEEIAPSLPPGLQAYVHGVSEGMTGGLAEGGLRQAIDLVGGKQAGDAYARTTQVSAEAHPYLEGAGALAGLAGSAVAGGALGRAGALVPSTGIGMVGNVVERGAARALAGVAERGVLGRAAAAGGALAARGAAEGALYGAASTIGDAMLNDHELAAEKLFAAAGTGALGGALAGGALGAGGSLAKSAASAVATGASNRLAKVLAPVQEAAAKAEGAAVKAEEGLTEAAAKAREPAKDLLEKVRGMASDEGVRDLAYDRAWRAAGGRKAFAAEANKYLPNGTKDVGEALLRHGVIDKEAGWIDAALKGTPQAIAERVEAPLASVGTRLGEIAENSGARVPAQKIFDATYDVAAKLEGKAGFEHVGAEVRNYGKSLERVLGITGPADTVKVQDLLEQRKYLDELVYQEAKTLDPKGRVAALREVRGKLEGVITDALDSASGKVAGELKNEYQALKHDYQALRIAQKAAQDSVDRGAANRTFSLTDKIVGSAAGGAGSIIGGPVGGLIAGPGAGFISKLVRERGDAAAAVLLHRAADMGSVQKLLAKVDEQIGRSATGLLSAPKSRPLPEVAAGPVIPRAQAVMQRVAEAKADPEGFASRVTRQTEGLSQTAPQLASAYTQTALKAAEFLASKLPATARPDPLDPNKRPRISEQDAAKVVKYADYADRPMKFFEEVEHGKVTREGVETAKALTPKTYADLQARTAQALADLQARGVTPPYQQRERLGILLDFPAVASQRPDHLVFLQGNVASTPPTDTMPAKPSTLPKRPSQMKPQQSVLDRLEGKGTTR